jgi:hypothetical protein
MCSERGKPLSQLKIVRKEKRNKETKMIPINPQRVEGQTFVGANIQIDGGVAYIRCKFVNCTIIVTGLGPIQMENTTFENPRWNFAGPAANTLNFLRMLWVNGQREIVEQIFQSIRAGVTQPVMAAQSQNPPNTGGSIQKAW